MNYTVCITNFSRPEHLRGCLQSVKNIPNVVVASYGAGPEHQSIINSVRPGTRSYVTPNDLGENRLLLQAVALADTEWVLILHDDDRLVPHFHERISNLDVGDAGLVAWDGLTEWFDGRPQKRIRPWGSLSEGAQPMSSLINDVTSPHHGMVRSPVTMLVRKDVAMAVLSWCEDGLKEFHTRPTMMIGNEIALLFGSIKQFETFYYVDEPLVLFGHWEGSETVKYVKGECSELVSLYDGVRSKFGGEQFAFRSDHSMPIVVHAHTGGSPGPRQLAAQSTWPVEWQSLEASSLIVPLRISDHELRRSSQSLGDDRPVPYLRDIIDRASEFCMRDSDVIHLTNDDIWIAGGGLAKMTSRAKEVGCTYAHRREFTNRQLSAIGMTSLNRSLAPDEIEKGGRHGGCDSISLTKGWWRDVGRKLLPDFLIGREAWDTIIIMIMRMSGSGWGWHLTTYHEYHDSFWKQDGNVHSNPGQLHNRALAKDFLQRHSFYRGEFEPGAHINPAYPPVQPGCDSEPNAPLIPYLGKHSSTRTRRMTTTSPSSVRKGVVLPLSRADALARQRTKSIR